MKILQYRTIAEVYPHLSLEAKVQLDNGRIIYCNMDVNDEGKKEDTFEYANWTYKEPLDEIDWNNADECYWFLTKEEGYWVFSKLLEFWNSNPVFDNNYEWKDFE